MNANRLRLVRPSCHAGIPRGEQRLSGVTPPSRPEHTMSYSAMDVMDSYTPPQPDAADPLPTTATTYQQNRDGAVELTTLADGRTIETPRDGTGRVTRIGLQRSHHREELVLQ